MPRARVPRTAIEYVELLDKRGVADLQRIFGCSRRAAEDLALQARRAVAQSRRYEVLEPPTGAAAVAVQTRPPMPGRAITDAEVRELAELVDPSALRNLPPEERHAAQREEQERLRCQRNAANNVPAVDPNVVRHVRSLPPDEQRKLLPGLLAAQEANIRERERLRRTPA
jgi:hypothetical protein